MKTDEQRFIKITHKYKGLDTKTKEDLNLDIANISYINALYCNGIETGDYRVTFFTGSNVIVDKETGLKLKYLCNKFFKTI